MICLRLPALPALALGLGIAAAAAVPASAVPNENECIANFAFNAAPQFSEVASKVDVNGDGFISPDEEIVVCTMDEAAENQNTG